MKCIWVCQSNASCSSVCNDFAQYYNRLSEWNAFWNRICVVVVARLQHAFTLPTTNWWWQIPRAIIIYRSTAEWVQEYVRSLACFNDRIFLSVSTENLFIWDLCVYIFRTVHKVATEIKRERENMRWRSRTFAQHRNWNHTKWLKAIKCSGKSYVWPPRQCATARKFRKHTKAK